MCREFGSVRGTGVMRNISWDVAYAHGVALIRKSFEFLSGNWMRFNQKPILGPILY
jgi:hypothetical protein